MTTLATTKLTSKGQIVIPEAIRKEFHLHCGDQFLVFGTQDTIILKTINLPKEEFKHLIAKTRKAAKQHGIKKTDIKMAIKKARKKT